MKKRIASIITATFLVLTLSPAAVFAVDGQNTDTTDTSSEVVQPTTTEQKTELQTRIEKRKAELKTALTTAQKSRIVVRCKASQGTIGNIKGRIQSAETNRSEVYKKVIDNLTALSTKLKNKGADTAALDADIATLQTKVTTFNTDIATYKQALSDLAAMDCAADPDGFKASLETARASLETVHKDVLDIRTYLKETVKPLLVTIRQQLAGEKDEAN